MIKRAEQNDIEGLNNLLLQVLTVHHNGRPDLFRANTRKYTEEQLLNMISNDRRPIFVEHDMDGKVSGYAFCIEENYQNDNIMTDRKTLYIDDICVREENRGQHIGTSLFEYVKKYAKENGFYNVTLNVWSCNKGAGKFYEACGMKPYKVGMETIL